MLKNNEKILDNFIINIVNSNICFCKLFALENYAGICLNDINLGIICKL